MKDIVLLFDTACIYEIVILNYFLKFTGSEVVFCSMDGGRITSMEGYSINVSAKLPDIKAGEIRSIIIPGGDVSGIKNEIVYDLLKNIKNDGKVIAGICAGVDVLDAAGVLRDVKSTHSEDSDITRDNHIITSRANAYVDFAIEVGKELSLFENEADLQETIDFWKFFKRM